MNEKIRALIDKLQNADLSSAYGVIGFDGFVDEIVHVVDKRYDSEHFKRIETIAAYGARISRAAGLSTNIEVVSIQRKIGGNGPIFGNALLKHGLKFAYIGALGYPKPIKVFDDFVKNCDAVSISDPGYTDAVEFLDGKIIRSKLEGLKDVSWDGLMRSMNVDELIALLNRTTFLAFMNWSLVVNVSSLWRGLLDKVFPALIPMPQRKLFVDLADPEKRSRKDLEEAIKLIERMGEYGRVTLGLNKKEACEIAALYGITVDDYRNVDAEELLELLLERLNVDTLLIHSVRSASGGQRGKLFHTVVGPYCENPRLTTGAGDNFNAGYMLGQIANLSVEESLYLAVYNSGFYVRNAYSPDNLTLIKFMKECLNEQI